MLNSQDVTESSLSYAEDGAVFVDAIILGDHWRVWWTCSFLEVYHNILPSMGSIYVYKAVHWGIGSKTIDGKPHRSSPRANRWHELWPIYAMEYYAATRRTDVYLMLIVIQDTVNEIN